MADAVGEGSVDEGRGEVVVTRVEEVVGVDDLAVLDVVAVGEVGDVVEVVDVVDEVEDFEVVVVGEDGVTALYTFMALLPPQYSVLLPMQVSTHTWALATASGAMVLPQ